LGKALLCLGRYAQTSYYFPQLCIHIWSVEELCYLFKTNPFILDQDILDRGLVRWLAEECGLTELGEQLMGLFKQANSVSLFVMTIMEYVKYCTVDEQKEVAAILQGNVGLKDYEKKKKRADYLATKGKYQTALREYDQILEMLPEGERALRGRIGHNRGTVLAHLFMFADAAESFRQAFELTGNEESGRQYLSALRRHLPEEEYIRFIADHPQFHNHSLAVERRLEQALSSFDETEENRMLFTMKVYKDDGNVNSYYEQIDQLMDKIKRQYRDAVI
jgi:tetratricopeptide (TPR) repeat protein